MTVNKNDDGTRGPGPLAYNGESGITANLQQTAVLVINGLLIAFELLRREREYTGK